MTMRRNAGYDSYGNCQFVVRPSDEFLRKKEFLSIANKHITECVQELQKRRNAFTSNERAKERIDRQICAIQLIMSDLSSFYDTDEHTYGRCLNGICFCLLRDTRFQGWKHYIQFYECRDISNDTLYLPLISAEIDETTYKQNHKREQKMFKNGGDDMSLYSFIIGSDEFEPCEDVDVVDEEVVVEPEPEHDKVEEKKQISKPPEEKKPMKRSTQSSKPMTTAQKYLMKIGLRH